MIKLYAIAYNTTSDGTAGADVTPPPGATRRDEDRHGKERVTGSHMAPLAAAFPLPAMLMRSHRARFRRGSGGRDFLALRNPIIWIPPANVDGSHFIPLGAKSKRGMSH